MYLPPYRETNLWSQYLRFCFRRVPYFLGTDGDVESEPQATIDIAAEEASGGSGFDVMVRTRSSRDAGFELNNATG